jgi:hypothetical protein
VTTLGVVLSVAFPALIQAQNRAELQVAAEVLSAAPSQDALRQVVQVVNGAEGSRGTLATITLDYIVRPVPVDSVADRPRAVVTVAFLRN